MILINSKGGTLNLPFTMSWTSVPMSYNIPVSKLDNGRSVRAGKVTPNPMSFTVKGNLYEGGSTYNLVKQNNRAKVDEIKAFLLHQPVEVEKFEGRRIISYVQSYNEEWMDDSQEVELSIGFLAIDPYVYGEPASFIIHNVSPDRYTTLVLGGSMKVSPVITMTLVSGTPTKVTISTGGYKLEATITLVAGVPLVVDCTKMVAIMNGVSVIGAMGDEFLIYGFELVPGDNPLEIQTVGGAVDILVEWRPRWS